MPAGDGPQQGGYRLPMPLSRVAAAPAAGQAPVAAFLSQLIAERDHLPPQRQRRRAPLPVAVASYATTAARAVPRLPPGYRRTLIA